MVLEKEIVIALEVAADLISVVLDCVVLIGLWSLGLGGDLGRVRDRTVAF